MPESVGAILLLLLGSGFAWWFFDKAWDFYRSYRRRSALKLVFRNDRLQPFYVEQSVWTDSHHAIRQVFCVGVTNAFSEPMTVRVVVEEIGYESPPIRPERPLQAFAATPGQADAIVQAGAIPSLFELAESFDSTDMAFICYAEPTHEAYPGRDTRVLIRAEGDGAMHRRAFRVRTHAAKGVRIPFTVEPDD